MTDQTDKSRSARVADFIFRHKVLWIVITIVLTVAAGYNIRNVQYEFSMEALFYSNPKQKEQLQKFEDLFGQDDNTILIAHGADDLFSKAGYERIRDITKKLEAMPYFERVVSLTNAENIKGTADGFETVPFFPETLPPDMDWEKKKQEVIAEPIARRSLISIDGYATAISMEIAPKYSNNKGREELIPKVKAAFAPYTNHGEWHLVGIPQLRNAYIGYMKKDQLTFIPLCALIVNILAYWLFRSFKANIFSLIVIALTSLWTISLMPVFGATINIITSVMPSLLMVMSMSYVTHFISRYIEENDAGATRDNAIRGTVQHMLLPIFLTSFTTGIGFFSLMVIDIRLVREFGAFSAIGLVVAFWITIFLLSALFQYTKPFGTGRGMFQSQNLSGRYLHWNDRFIKKHPWPVIAVSLVLFAASTYFVFQIKVDSKIMDEMNPKSPEYQGHEFVTKYLAGIVPLEVLIEAPERDAFMEPTNLHKLNALEDSIRKMKGVDYVISLADVMKKMNQAMHEDAPDQYAIPETRQTVAQYNLLYGGEDLGRLVTTGFDKARVAIRCDDIGSKRVVEIEQAIVRAGSELFGPGFNVQVTGSSVMIGKLMDRLISDMVKSLFMAAILITVLLALLFRSLRLGALAMIPNLLPIIMTLGLLGAAGITLRTSIVVVFSISLGIAVDDTVHFITRCRNELQQTGDYDKALHNTFIGTGRPIIFTSVLLFLGFGVLGGSNFIPTRNFGMLSAVTMVSALVGDLFLLPALLWLVKPKMK